MAQAPNTPSRLTIHFAVDGFPCDLDLEATAADFAQRVQRAVQTISAAGGVPPVTVTAPASTPPGETPVCEYHGPMKESTKRPGSWFCPAKMGDGSYCESKT